MKKSDPTKTKEKILRAAHKIFINKGMAGARMQEIADEAGINKALLHYHFKNKDTLFHEIFKQVFSEMFTQINQLFSVELPLFKKIENFIELYLDMLNANPYLPMFVIYELNHSPNTLKELINKIDINTNIFSQSVEKEINKGTIKPINPNDLLINIVSLCIFPIVAKPIISSIFNSDNEKEMSRFLEARKKTIPEFIINAIKE